MRPSLVVLIRARIALWHTRRAIRHTRRAEGLMFDAAPIVRTVDLAAAAGALAFVVVAVAAFH